MHPPHQHFFHSNTKRPVERNPREYVLLSAIRKILSSTLIDCMLQLLSEEGTKLTQSAAPVTPTHKPPSRNSGLGHHVEDLPSGGVNLRSNSHSTPTHTNVIEPVSPAGVANIGVRRSKYGAVLLQSPARAGHAVRMKQIFEESSEASRHPHCNLYPQLPNISRKAVGQPASKSHSPPIVAPYRPESVCLSSRIHTTVPQHAELCMSYPQRTICSSESWSDDSGYIVTNSRGRSSSFGIPLNEQIYGWLSSVSPGPNTTSGETDGKLVNKSTSGHSGVTHIPPASVALGVNAQESYASSHLDSEELDSYFNSCEPVSPLPSSNLQPIPTYNGDITIHSTKPYLTAPEQPTAQTTTSSFEFNEEGGVPLSPNVCTERGPSRHRSTRKTRKVDASTPTKPSRHENRKENLF